MNKHAGWRLPDDSRVPHCPGATGAATDDRLLNGTTSNQPAGPPRIYLCLSCLAAFRWRQIAQWQRTRGHR
jgi:hypothetical protein